MVRSARPILAGGVLAVLLAAGPARADAIDAALVRDSAGVAKAVRGLHAKSLAVLKFRVQVGDGEPSFRVGTLGADMARRLENLLVAVGDPAKPEVEVLSGAGEEAARQARAAKRPFDWTTPAGRAELARLKLPVLWDRSRVVAPDGFLTGTVRVAADRRTLAVDIQAFTRTDPATLRTVWTVGEATGLRTDRDVLTSLGQSFAVPPRVVVRGPDKARAEADENAFVSVEEVVTGGATKVPGPVALRIFYDDAEAELKPGRSGEFQATTPQPGQFVRFFLTNTGPKRVAVLLAVNGRNTLNLNGVADDLAAPARPRDEFQMWLLDPNVLYEIDGFLTDKDAGTRRPFEAKPEDVSEREYGALDPAYAGRFQMIVFGEKPTPVPAKPNETLPRERKRPVLSGTLPAVTARPADAPAPQSAAGPTSTAKAAGTFTLSAADSPLPELQEDEHAGALSVVRGFGNAGTPEAAQKSLLAALGRVRLPDGALQKPAKGRVMVGAGTEAPGTPTKVIPFAHDPSPIANVVVGYYAPKKSAP